MKIASIAGISPSIVNSLNPWKAGPSSIQFLQPSSPAHLLHKSFFPPLLPQLTYKMSSKASAFFTQPRSLCSSPLRSNSKGNLQARKPTEDDTGPLPMPTRSLPEPLMAATESPLPPNQNPQLNVLKPTTEKGSHLNWSAKTFRDAVTGSRSGTAEEPNIHVDVSFSSANQRNLSTHKGEPALLLSKEEEEVLAQPYNLTLVGKFSNGKPSMAALRKEILTASFSVEVHLGLVHYRHVFFKFELEKNFHRMWTRRIWNFFGFSARIFLWSLRFSPDIESSIAPVWIKLAQLPLHLFNKYSIFALASAVGNPLQVERATASAVNLLRPSEARVLVELDVL